MTFPNQLAGQKSEGCGSGWGLVQELLHHPFLRPSTAPAVPANPGQVGLTCDQLKKLLSQVQLLPSQTNLLVVGREESSQIQIPCTHLHLQNRYLLIGPTMPDNWLILHDLLIA